MWRNWVPHILLVGMGNDAGILEYNLGIPQKVKKGLKKKKLLYDPEILRLGELKTLRRTENIHPQEN